MDKSTYGKFVEKANSSDQDVVKEIYRFQISDERINLNGWKFLIDGMNITEYMGNPLVLAGHRRSEDSVIGKAVNVFVNGKKLFADIEFHEKNEKSSYIKSMVEDGYLSFTSVGLRVNPDVSIKKPIPPSLKGRVHTWDNKYTEYPESTLVEISIVPFPANTGAKFKKKISEAIESGIFNEEEVMLHNGLINIDENEKENNFQNTLEEEDMPDILERLKKIEEKLNSDDSGESNEIALQLLKECKEMQTSNEELAGKLSSADDQISELKLKNEEISEKYNGLRDTNIELEVDNFLASNKHKLLPAEMESKKVQLLAARKNEDMKIGDKTLYEVMCDDISGSPTDTRRLGEALEHGEDKSNSLMDVVDEINEERG
jgi:hypothetical protein